MVIRRISEQDAPILRDLRLRALHDAPTAFSSTYQKESELDPEEWSRRARRWATSFTDAIFLAFDEDSPSGMVGSYVEQDTPGQAQIVSMWVDPKARRSGVGASLIDAVAAFNRALGVREARLMVTSVNPGAMAFYARMGFSRTGMTQPYPNDPEILEYEMALALEQGAATGSARRS